MNTFRYKAVQAGGQAVSGTIEAGDRKKAIQLLGEQGLYPSSLEPCPPDGRGVSDDLKKSQTPPLRQPTASFTFSARGIRRKEITGFTRQMAALIESAIPIPQALESLGEEEENPAFKNVILNIADEVRRGKSLSTALDEHPRLFNRLYTSMIRVGEEAGALQFVMSDLASLMEHEDEVRSEVVTAVSYPIFVLAFGIFTVVFLLTFVLPRLFGLLQDTMDTLPLPTLVLLSTAAFLKQYWPAVLLGFLAVVGGVGWYLRTPDGVYQMDRIKLRIPVLGGVFRSAALSRFARTLGTLVKSGVSLLPALKIVENTIGNVVLAQWIAQVSEETRGGDSLAGPLRRLNIFPSTVIKMIGVGEESGKLDEMLLKAAEIEERQMRARTKTLISLLAPAMILVVGAIVGFMVLAILLPIFQMSQSIR